MAERIFKPIPQWEGLYAFDGVDTVKSLPRVVYKSDGTHQTYKERVLKWGTSKDGRQFVRLADTTNGRLQTLKLHQAVWMYHNEQPIPEGCEIHHIDGDFTNNDISNLQLLTAKEHKELHEQFQKNNYRSKTVQALDSEGNVVFEFPSIAEAGRQGFDQGHVSEACNGKRKTHKGYWWRYKNG